MIQNKQNLIIEQMDKKMALFGSAVATEPPATGWVCAIRTTLKMSLRQFGERLQITSQSAKEIEQREALGTVSLKSLKEAARAMNMKFVYGFVPASGSLQTMIETRALEMAKEIVMRTSQTMKLEDQELPADRLQKAIHELANELKQEMPRYLWDLK